MLRSLSEILHELGQEWLAAVHRYPYALIGTVALFTLLAIVPLGASIKLLSLRSGLPDKSAVSRIGEMDQTTTIFDSRDQLAFTIFKEQRIEVPLAEVSPNFVRAIIAIEDQRFYDHHGVDPVRVMSAALANIRRRRAAQGASTITQQLARQSFLTPDKTIRRKFQEALLAGQIEQMYTKPQILELYVNKVYYGDGLYGVEAASRGYFGKRAAELSVPEAALLAGLVKSPSSYAPTMNMERAMTRRNLVLQAMLDTGAITRAQWQEARAAKVVLADNLRAQEPHGEYFKEQLRRELVDRFGWQLVYQGGLRVFSTIDMRLQIEAESAVAASLKGLDARVQAVQSRRQAAQSRAAASTNRRRAPLQAALVALDPQTGHVRAMVGGRDFGESRFNRAVQAKRQPGSAFKPFVYAAALEAGYSPATVIDGLNDSVATGQGPWTPEDHSTSSAMTLRTGLRTSSNRAAVRLLQQVGIPRTVEYARTMGVGDLPSVPSLALGSGEVTVLSLTAAYAAFANHGLVPRPTLIRRVEDHAGVLLYQSQDVAVRAVSDTTAFLMASMMADVVNAGTGASARQLGFTLPAAGKTGTTNDFNDAWFVGFTPKLATGVWVGFDQPHTILPNGFAAGIAVPLWATFMKTATRGDSPEWFAPPPGVTTATVCRQSGKLAGDGCQSVEVVNRDGELEMKSMVYTEYFARGTEPTAVCDLHPTHGILGRIASGIGTLEEPPPLPEPRIRPLSAPAPNSEPNGPGPALAPAATTGTEPPPGTVRIPPVPEVLKTKRGFWSRVFGVGKGDPQKPEEEQKPRRKKGG